MQIKSARLLVLTALAVTACGRAEDRAATGSASGADAAASRSSAPKPLDRAALLIAATKAGSAVALRQDDTAEQRTLDGRAFEVRIRFACASSPGTAAVQPSAPKAGPFNVRFTSTDRTLRVKAAPDLTRNDPNVTALGSGATAVEGFWMRRPWLLEAGCPASGGSSAVSDQRVGIAQFFTEADTRAVRHEGEAYESTKVLSQTEQPSRQGYDLVLSGMLRKLPSGRVIACRATGAETPPECMVSAQFERVRIETIDGKTVLGDWKSQ